MDNPSSFRKANSYLKRMREGDRVVAFLKDRRLGGWGVVTKPYDDAVFDPQLRPGTKDPDFGRVVHIRWEQQNAPPIGQAARMRPEDVHGFAVMSTVQPVSDEAFDRISKIIQDRSRWEPLSELAEENSSDEVPEELDQEEWLSPLREAALRRILAKNLELLEPGLVSYDGESGPEEVAAGAAGRIDLLCKDKKGNYVVVELKRDSSSDVVIGQLARYIGYVKENFANGKLVRGIIVAHDVDERLRLAMGAVPNVELKVYDVTVAIRPGSAKKR